MVQATANIPPDTAAPVITEVTADPGEFWPPNNKMRSVTVGVTATGDSAFSRAITSVRDNETGEAGDWSIAGDLTVDLRAQGGGGGSGQVYSINARCIGVEGNSADDSVDVTVAHHQGNGKANGRNK